MSTTNESLAESGRLAVALARALETGDQPVQLALLSQISANGLTASTMLSLCSITSNLVASIAEAIEATPDEVWHALLIEHGEVQS